MTTQNNDELRNTVQYALDQWASLEWKDLGDLSRLMLDLHQALKAQPEPQAVAVQSEPVKWEYRWTNPGNNLNEPAREFQSWQPVAQKTFQTLEGCLEELREYRYNNKPVYEVRALYTTPPATQAVQVEAMREALRRIAAWEIPAAQVNGVAMSYDSAYGSNGARDYVRKIASDALASHPALPPVTQAPQGWKQECDDADELLRLLGLEPDSCRTDGGSINLPKVKTLLSGKAQALQVEALILNEREACAQAVLQREKEARGSDFPDALDFAKAIRSRLRFALASHLAPQPQAKPLTDEHVEAGASALVDSCITKGHWAHASNESKTIYREYARAVLAAAHGITPATGGAV